MADFAGRSGHNYVFAVEYLLQVFAHEFIACLEGLTLYSVRKVGYIFSLKILTKFFTAVINYCVIIEYFYHFAAMFHSKCFLL